MNAFKSPPFLILILYMQQKTVRPIMDYRRYYLTALRTARYAIRGGGRRLPISRLVWSN